MNRLAVPRVEADAGEVVVAVEAKVKHRVGIGWRPEIAAFILDNSELIHDIEIIIENFYELTPKEIQSIRFLSSLYHVHFHSVSLGIAGSGGLPKSLIKKLKRFFSFFPIENWSDHFSFVRSGEIELGHLATPSWNEKTIEIVLTNLMTVKKELGSLPCLENVSSLLYPPNSTMTETDWITSILNRTNTHLLLDINNVYCNAVNFGRDPFKELAQYPFERVKQIHMSGGKWIETSHTKHMLDDHKHDIPEIGFQMLKIALKHIEQPVSIIIERDGNYPANEVIRSQLKRIHHIIKDKDISHELLSL